VSGADPVFTLAGTGFRDAARGAIFTAKGAAMILPRPRLPAVLPWLAAVLLWFAPVVSIRAEEPPVHAIGGFALGGHDVVAYFTEGRPVPGDRRHALKWRGAVWLFASPETLLAFEMNPRAYAPRFGGYCAWALSEGKLASGDPAAFAIRDNRLYVAHSPEFLARWLDDPEGRIDAARARWPAILRR